MAVGRRAPHREQLKADALESLSTCQKVVSEVDEITDEEKSYNHIIEQLINSQNFKRRGSETISTISGSAASQNSLFHANLL